MMATEKTPLAHNIRYFRKMKRMSQEELSQALDIKRSNIAAYESKSVEPRLRIILKLAKLFNVSVRTLIETKINDGDEYLSYDQDTYDPAKVNLVPMDLEQNNDISEFVEKSMKIRKILEGFKAFYNFKKNNLKDSTPQQEKLLFDIDNFISLLEHLMNYNESVIKALISKRRSSSTTNSY